MADPKDPILEDAIRNSKAQQSMRPFVHLEIKPDGGLDWNFAPNAMIAFGMVEAFKLEVLEHSLNQKYNLERKLVVPAKGTSKKIIT